MEGIRVCRARYYSKDVSSMEGVRVCGARYCSKDVSSHEYGRCECL